MDYRRQKAEIIVRKEDRRCAREQGLINMSYNNNECYVISQEASMTQIVLHTSHKNLSSLSSLVGKSK